MKGNFLRMPVYRIKQEEGDETQGRKSVGNLGASRQNKVKLTSSVNFANRGSTNASWQVDDIFDPLTNGNFTRTEMT